MMTPLYGGGAGKFEVVGTSTANSSGTTLTANATPGSDGAWTQLTAATVNDWHAIHILIHHGATASGQELVDVGIGGAGAEFVVVADIPVGVRAALARCEAVRVSLPLYVAAGSRVSARIHRASVASLTTRIAIIGENCPIRRIPSFCRATTYGTDLANFRGTSVDPGAVANTKGTRTQVVASTTNPITALYILCTRRDSAAIASDVEALKETFVGGAGVEVSLIGEFQAWEGNNSGDVSNGRGTAMGPFLVNLPAASRLSCEARASSATAGEREFQVTYIGLD